MDDQGTININPTRTISFPLQLFWYLLGTAAISGGLWESTRNDLSSVTRDTIQNSTQINQLNLQVQSAHDDLLQMKTEFGDFVKQYEKDMRTYVREPAHR